MEAISQQQTELIGKDVLVNTTLTYHKLEQTESGVNITAVLCIDPAGSLPTFIKRSIAADNSKVTEAMVKHIRKQKGLE